MKTDTFTKEYLKIINEDISYEQAEDEEDFEDLDEDDLYAEILDDLYETGSISLDDIKNNNTAEKYHKIEEILKKAGYFNKPELLNGLIDYYQESINNTIEDFGADEVSSSQYILLDILRDLAK